MTDGKILLPGGVQVDTAGPSPELQALGAITANQKVMYQALMQISHQLEVLVRLECGADKRAVWKERFLENDMLNKAAEEASFQKEMADMPTEEETFGDEGTDGEGTGGPGGGQEIEGQARLEVVPEG